MKSQEFELAIIGLGAVGSAALHYAAKSGKEVIGIDRFDPPHSFGSSHGETRITRLSVGEGEDYVALAKRSHELWKELEKVSGQQVYFPTSGILLDSGIQPWSKHGSEGFFDRTVRFAQSQKIRHSLLGSEELSRLFPAFELPIQGRGYLESEAGYLKPELAIELHLKQAQNQGAEILRNSPVQSLQKNASGYELVLEGKVITARQVAVTAGGWILDFMDSSIDRQKFKICRQVLHWIEADFSEVDWSSHPVWMWGFGPNPEDFIYGFPSLDGKTIKMASESFIETPHPNLLDREVSPEEQDRFFEEKVKSKVRGLLPRFVKSQVCFYTVTEDARFVLEHPGGDSNLLLVSACSGHGFKHSAALGERIAKIFSD